MKGVMLSPPDRKTGVGENEKPASGGRTGVSNSGSSRTGEAHPAHPSEGTAQMEQPTIL
jgi:hypothetical protein